MTDPPAMTDPAAMLVLVTRPAPDGESFAAVLAARGFVPLLAPLLEIEILPADAAPLDLAGLQALAFTSANGLRAFAARSPRRDLPAFAVGDATARAARAAGFDPVHSAEGDVEALAALIIDRLDPGDGAILHPAASAVAGDLAGRLGAAGFELRRVLLYRSTQVEALPAALREALTAARLDVATFFSPRTAAAFAGLIRDAGLADRLSGCLGICLSAAVAAELAALPWRALRTAEAPTQESLLASLAQISEAGAMRQEVGP